MSKPFSFIPFLETKPYKVISGKLRGVINLKIEVLNAIHVSKDSYDMDESNVIYKEFYKIGSNYAIPGTSLKGMIRSIAEMVSNSCISAVKDEFAKLPHIKHRSCKIQSGYNAEDTCIICDIFGAMGRKSKIKISNFIYEDKTGEISVEGLPVLRGPHIEEDHIYLNEDKKFKGYKIYNHGISSILKTGNYQCECLKNGAIFNGRILYENLDEEELKLLCYAVGLCGDFNHKAGYGKPAYYGSINITCDDEKYVEYAKQYKEDSPEDIKSNIKLLEENYSYKKARKKPDYEENTY